MQGRERKSEREREGAYHQKALRSSVRRTDGPKEGGEVRKKWARSDGAAAEVFVGIAARELGVGERERGAKSAPSVREREMKSERVREGAWDQKPHAVLGETKRGAQKPQNT